MISVFRSLLLGLTLGLGLAAAEDLASLGEQIRRSPLTSAKDGLFRQLAVESIVTGQREAGLQFLGDFIGQGFRKDPDRKPNSSQQDLLAYAADATILVALVDRHARDVTFRRDVLEWLTEDEDRYQLVLNTVSGDDNWAGMMAIIDQLYDHDPKQRDEYFRLILAMAVVWDERRPPLHYQMGGKALPYQPDIEARYDYFRDLYAAKRSEMPYDDLSVTALTFVVDLPLPLAELEWVRQNEAPRAWEKKYTEIVYSDARLNALAYQWPDGPYTMAAIREQGGICVDQAYYALVCARAWGLPAFIFTGEGRRGPHAWFGYMKDKSKWEMDVGRYTFDKYATGHAIDPQSNQPMSDHYVEFTCDRSLSYSRYRVAARYGRLAQVLATLGYDTAARQAAERSLDAAPLYEFAWTVLEVLLAKDKAIRELCDLLDRKANVFRKYADVVASVRQRQAELLRQLGENDKADRMVDRNARQVGRDRDDLARFLANEQIRAAYEKGDYPEAMKRFEDLLKDQREEGQKIFSLMEDYLALAQITKQNEEAVKFLKRYVDSLRNTYGSSPNNERLFLGILARAYEQAGDERNLKRIQKKLEDLR